MRQCAADGVQPRVHLKTMLGQINVGVPGREWVPGEAQGGMTPITRCVIAQDSDPLILSSYFAAAIVPIAPLAASSMREATACGCDTYTAWLPLTSTTVEPARLDIAR